MSPWLHRIYRVTRTDWGFLPTLALSLAAGAAVWFGLEALSADFKAWCADQGRVYIEGGHCIDRDHKEKM